jgi:hypothetical protein
VPFKFNLVPFKFSLRHTTARGFQQRGGPYAGAQ